MLLTLTMFPWVFSRCGVDSWIRRTTLKNDNKIFLELGLPRRERGNTGNMKLGKSFRTRPGLESLGTNIVLPRPITDSR